jgi:hypothetical protein
MLPFQHPTTVMIAGPTGCGKTQFLVNVFKFGMIRPHPQRIVWIYSEWQPAYDEIRSLIKGSSVEFVKDFDDNLYQTIDPAIRNVVVLDDQMENENMHKNGGSKLAKFFTQGSHHRNLTIIYIVQNVFHRSPAMRTVSLNSHYLVLFANPRDKTQIRTLATQMYPDSPHFLMDAFKDATSSPYGYLVVDLRPNTPNILRARTNIFDETKQVIYTVANDDEAGSALAVSI